MIMRTTTAQANMQRSIQYAFARVRDPTVSEQSKLFDVVLILPP